MEQVCEVTLKRNSRTLVTTSGRQASVRTKGACEDNPIAWVGIARCPQAQQPVHYARPVGENRRLGRRANSSLGPSADEVARFGVLESPAADRGVPRLLRRSTRWR